MNRALVVKTMRDAAALLLVLTASILVFELAAARMLVEAAADLEYLRMWLERPLVQFLVRVAFGGELKGDLTSTLMATFALGHPLLWALSWTFLLTLATGVIVGEVGRGTADLLLTLPLSRRTIYTSVTLVCGAGTLVISFAPLLGLWLGERLFPPRQPLEFARLWPLSVNLLALNLGILGLTLLISSVVSRRGQAIAVVLACLLASDLINILAPFLAAVRRFAFLGFLHYYRPLPVVRSGQLPWSDLATLLGVTLVAWLLGLWYFSRRDIPAV